MSDITHIVTKNAPYLNRNKYIRLSWRRVGKRDEEKIKEEEGKKPRQNVCFLYWISLNAFFFFIAILKIKWEYTKVLTIHVLELTMSHHKREWVFVHVVAATKPNSSGNSGKIAFARRISNWIVHVYKKRSRKIYAAKRTCRFPVPTFGVSK